MRLLLVEDDLPKLTAVFGVAIGTLLALRAGELRGHW
jgi:hypothetical protein